MTTPNPDAVAEARAAQLGALMDMVETLGPLVASCAGYRQQCIGAGFSPANAETMAVQLHGAVIAMMFKMHGSAVPS